MLITAKRKQDADDILYPEITSITPAVLAEDTNEACSSF